MSRLLAYIAAILVFAPLAAMFAEPFYEAVFDALGWDTENFGLPFVNAMFEVFSDGWFRMAASALVGIGIGIWCHKLALKADFTDPKLIIEDKEAAEKQTQEIMKLGERCCESSDDIFNFLSNREADNQARLLARTNLDVRDEWDARIAFEAATHSQLLQRYGQRITVMMGRLKTLGIEMPPHFASAPSMDSYGIPKVFGAFGGLLTDARLSEAVSLSKDEKFMWSISR